MRKLNVLLATVVITVPFASANPPPRGDKGPPPEAIEACQGLEEGAAVTFETPRGDKLDATCRVIEEQLVAVPDNHRRGER